MKYVECPLNCATSGNIYLNIDKYHAIRYRIRSPE